MVWTYNNQNLWTRKFVSSFVRLSGPLQTSTKIHGQESLSPHLLGWVALYKFQQHFKSSFFLHSKVLWDLQEKEERWHLMFPPMWIKVLLHFQVGLTLYVMPKRALWQLEKPWWLFFLPKVSTLNEHKQVGRHLSPPRVITNVPTWLVGNICVNHRRTRNQSARKVTHPNIIAPLGCLTLEFSWDSC